MSSFKYVTPYWRDSHTNYPENSDAYTSTVFYILNPNDVDSTFIIQYFDLDGKQYVDMQTSFVLEPNNVLDVRILDVIRIKNPNYSSSSALRSGSIRIISNTKLSVKGKIVKGETILNVPTEKFAWSISFDEFLILESDSNKFKLELPKPFTNFRDYFNKVRKPR